VGRNTGAFLDAVEVDEIAEDEVDAADDWPRAVDANSKDTAISRSIDLMFLISP